MTHFQISPERHELFLKISAYAEYRELKNGPEKAAFLRERYDFKRHEVLAEQVVTPRQWQRLVKSIHMGRIPGHVGRPALLSPKTNRQIVDLTKLMYNSSQPVTANKLNEIVCIQY